MDPIPSIELSFPALTECALEGKVKSQTFLRTMQSETELHLQIHTLYYYNNKSPNIENDHQQKNGKLKPIISKMKDSSYNYKHSGLENQQSGLTQPYTESKENKLLAHWSRVGAAVMTKDFFWLHYTFSVMCLQIYAHFAQCDICTLKVHSLSRKREE